MPPHSTAHSFMAHDPWHTDTHAADEESTQRHSANVKQRWLKAELNSYRGCTALPSHTATQHFRLQKGEKEREVMR